MMPKKETGSSVEFLPAGSFAHWMMLIENMRSPTKKATVLTRDTTITGGIRKYPSFMEFVDFINLVLYA